jgi:hypothetical protein
MFGDHLALFALLWLVGVGGWVIWKLAREWSE